MGKTFLRKLNGHANLYRYDNGIAIVTDGSTGLIHSCHPNIDASGSVTGMKKLGYWGKDDIVVKAGSYKYNISHTITSGGYDKTAKESCMCRECLRKKETLSYEELDDDNLQELYGQVVDILEDYLDVSDIYLEGDEYTNLTGRYYDMLVKDINSSFYDHYLDEKPLTREEMDNLTTSLLRVFCYIIRDSGNEPPAEKDLKGLKILAEDVFVNWGLYTRD